MDLPQMPRGTGLAALLLAGSFVFAPLPAQAQDALGLAGVEARYQSLGQQGVGDKHLQPVLLQVDLGASPGYSLTYDSAAAMLEVRYAMAFNQLTEGWSWQPGVNPEVEDYYRFKFLPLGSRAEVRGEYQGEDKIGEPEKMRVEWRYDYFLAFDNLYDFYPRVVDDEAGFVARIAASPEQAVQWQAPGRLRLLAQAHLTSPYVAESTTFWKADHAQPQDFTLKKRYLVGVLDEIRVQDASSGDVLARLAPARPGKP